MPTLSCPECTATQDITVTPDTYVVVCIHCGHEFKIPREHRVEKRDLKEYTSSVNIRIGYRESDGMMDVGWTVQSAEKGNQYLERDAVTVDTAEHPQKVYWYVAIFKALQHVNEYKSARIWVKHEQVIDHLAGEIRIAEDDLRSRLATSIIELCDEKFFGYEFGVTDHIGRDIQQLLS